MIKLNIIDLIVGLIGTLVLGVLLGLYLIDNTTVRYDVNRDGKVNAQDYVLIKNYIMED